MRTIKKKIMNKLLKLLQFAVIIPFIVLIRLLERFWEIKFKSLRYDAIGHFVIESDLYLTYSRFNSMFKKRCINLFYIEERQDIGILISNKFFEKLLKREICSLNFNWIIRKTRYFLDLFPDSEKYNMDWPYSNLSDQDFLLSKTSCNYNFKKKEIEIGEKSLLEKFGYSGEKPIVCFFNRDSAYHQKHCSVDTGYHSYRDSNIRNFQLTIEKFSDRYHFFRMGKTAKEKFEPEELPVTDYASSIHKSDFLDFYIFSKAKFILGSNTGLTNIPIALRKRICVANMAPLMCYYNQGGFDPTINTNLIIFKKYFSKKLGRLLKASEIYQLGAHRFNKTCLFEEHAIELIENTQEEIYELSNEYIERMNNNWEDEYELLGREDEFFKIMGVPYKSTNRYLYPKIGSHFLRNNNWLYE